MKQQNILQNEMERVREPGKIFEPGISESGKTEPVKKETERRKNITDFQVNFKKKILSHQKIGNFFSDQSFFSDSVEIPDSKIFPDLLFLSMR